MDISASSGWIPRQQLPRRLRRIGLLTVLAGLSFASIAVAAPPAFPRPVRPAQKPPAVAPRIVPARPAVPPAAPQRVPRLAAARIVVPGGFAGASEEGQIVLAPREQARALRMAAELVESGQHVEATELLQRVLELGEDSFVQPDTDKEVYRSLWREAQRIVGELPPEALETYRRQFGPEADRLLQDAVADGDPRRLVEVTRRFFHTEAGRTATYRLGAWHFDHGQLLAAALCFERLRESGEADDLEPILTLRAAVCWHHAGQPKRADALLASLAESHDGPVTLGGRPVPLGDADARAEWLASIARRAEPPLGTASSWSGHRGDADRNPTVAAQGEPGELLWTASPAADPFRSEREIAEDELLQKLAIEGASSLRGSNLPVRQPLVVGDLVLARSMSGVTALDRGGNGAFLWQGFRDAGFERLLPVDGDLSGIDASRISGIRTKATHHVWHDATFGRMSTDGERVYSIEAPDMLPATTNPQQYVSRTNMLCAYDIVHTEGFQEWAVGGEADVGDFELPLAGCFFLGPPLPLGGQLYCLAQCGGEVELIVLEARTGELAWRQPLVSVGDLASAVDRQHGGAVVAVADGIVVCPTGTGTFVALDLTTRSLLWAYRAPSTARQLPPNVRRLGGRGVIIVNGRPVVAPPNGRGGWLDETPVIVDGKVLLTPQRGDEIYCVSLLDGSLLWKQPQKDSLYLAGVVDGTALLVGEQSVRGLKLADGENAWDALRVPTVVGTGLVTGHRLWLPAGRELIAVDAKEGMIATRQRVPESVSLGNLAATSELLISQGVDEVYAFPWQMKADAEGDAEGDAEAH